jgi:FAD/FMN-containing dehydrogenase
MSFDPAALDALRSTSSGPVLSVNDPGYHEARELFNAMIDRRPAAIAQCESAGDVVSAVRFARDAGLEIAVRGGGHSVAGKSLCDGGLVIDLRHMNAVSVDPQRRTVTVGGGATISNLDRGTQPYGLATTGGRVSTTGVGGFGLGGGTGWLDRKLGLACDNLVAVELVTASGEQITANADEHADLFWALHGGGGNFGVATSLTLRLHELADVTVALLLFAAAAGPEVLPAYREFMASAPDDLGGGAIYLTGPEADFVPQHLIGKLAFAVLLIHAGPEPVARRVMAPLLDLGHDGGLIAQMPYADMQCMFDDPPGYRNYWSCEYLAEFPDDAVQRFCARADDMVVPSPSQHVLFPQGGAVARGPTDYPLPWRHAPWCVHPFGLWSRPEDDERARQWAHAACTDMQPWSTGAVYHNFMGDEGEARLIAGFGRESHARLRRIKSQYDPDNVFHLNHNVRPASWPNPFRV